jgi:hypothetical protein
LSKENICLPKKPCKKYNTLLESASKQKKVGEILIKTYEGVSAYPSHLSSGRAFSSHQKEHSAMIGTKQKPERKKN